MSKSMFMLLLSTLIFASQPASAQGQDRPVGVGGIPIEITADLLTFTYASQDGEVSYPCTHKLSDEILRDWDVTCSSPTQPGVEFRFQVHLRLHANTHVLAPKINYELLFWVTDQQIAKGQPGRYVGTTMWFHMKEPSDLVTLDVAQDVDETFTLRSTIEMKAAQ